MPIILNRSSSLSLYQPGCIICITDTNFIQSFNNEKLTNFLNKTIFRLKKVKAIDNELHIKLLLTHLIPFFNNCPFKLFIHHTFYSIIDYQLKGACKAILAVAS